MLKALALESGVHGHFITSELSPELLLVWSSLGLISQHHSFLCIACYLCLQSVWSEYWHWYSLSELCWCSRHLSSWRTSSDRGRSKSVQTIRCDTHYLTFRL